MTVDPNALVHCVDDAAGDELALLAASAAGYARDARAPATRRAYERDWRSFVAWASERGLPSFPASPATVAAYAAELADSGQRTRTIDRKLAAIAFAHKLAGHASPLSEPRVREVRAGIRRRLGTAPKQKAALAVTALAALVSQLPDGPKGVRDRALLTVGFFAALRRSELVALEVADVAFAPEGVTFTIRRSKTDQEGGGAEVAVPNMADPALCPVRALRAWLDLAGIAQGALFRRVHRHGRIGSERLSGRAVALVVKELARAAGLTIDVAAHSLRAGFATSAAAAGKSEAAIMRQGRWRSVTVARGYVRHGSRFRDNAADGLA